MFNAYVLWSRIKRAEIHEVNRENMTKHAIDLWKAGKNPNTPIIVQTNRQKAEINSAIKGTFDQNGPGLKHTIWRPVYTSQSKKTLAKTYKDATHLRISRDVKRDGLKRGDIYKIESVDEKRNTITLSAGRKTKTFKPAKRKLHKDKIQLFKQDSITLHTKDRVRFTRGGRDRNVNNNDRATLKALEDKTITLVMDKGKTITLPHNASELRHMDHGWALTAYAVQGKTEKSAIVVMPSNASPLTTLDSLYVGMSRHKENVSLVTDNADRLKFNLENALDIKMERMDVHKGQLEKPRPENDQAVNQRRKLTIHDRKDVQHHLLQGLKNLKPQLKDISRSRGNDQGR